MSDTGQPEEAPNAPRRRDPRRSGAPPGEPSPQFIRMVQIMIIGGGWLLVATSGLCSVGFWNLGGGLNRPVTLESVLGLLIFIGVFFSIPITAAIVMFVYTRRTLRNRKK